MSEHLISVSDLAERLSDPMVRIADTRWYLGEPTKGREEYDAGHIPGAIYIDLDRHLSGHGGPGRHPLPPPSVLGGTLGRHGVGDEHLVVAYDDRGGAVAARMWWMLREIGHASVKVLDGGLQAWIDAGHELDTVEPITGPADLTVRPPLTRTIERASVLSRLGSLVLLDSRAPERYRGDEEPIDPVAGHIPTALSAPLDMNLAEDGRFLPPEALAERYRELGADADQVVAYCGSGVNACHTILATAVAGLPEPMLYAGSWSDWSTAGLAVATGPDPGAAPATWDHAHGSLDDQIVHIADYDLIGDVDEFVSRMRAVTQRVETEGVAGMSRFSFYVDRRAGLITSVVTYCCADAWLQHRQMKERWGAERAELGAFMQPARLRLLGPLSSKMRSYLANHGIEFEEIAELVTGFVRTAR